MAAPQACGTVGGEQNRGGTQVTEHPCAFLFLTTRRDWTLSLLAPEGYRGSPELQKASMCVCLSFLPPRAEDGEDDPWDNLIKAGKRVGKTRIPFFSHLARGDTNGL